MGKGDKRCEKLKTTEIEMIAFSLDQKLVSAIFVDYSRHANILGIESRPREGEACLW